MLSHSRIRELSDTTGVRIRVSIDDSWSGLVVVLERPDLPAPQSAVLDAYGAEMLAGYIMAARLALPDALGSEQVDGLWAAELSLLQDIDDIILVRQTEAGRSIALPFAFWDRLYAELCLLIPRVRAHAAATPSPQSGFRVLH